MIAALLEEPAALRALGETLRAAPLPAVVVPDAISAVGAAGLRLRVRNAGLAPYWIADRGRYALNDTWRDERLFARLRDLGAAIAGEALDCGPARWTLHTAGSYALSKDDRLRSVLPRAWELTIDFSATTWGAADTMHTSAEGQSAVVPQLARSLVLVARTPGTVRAERYVPSRLAGAEVFRLRLWLTPRGT